MIEWKVVYQQYHNFTNSKQPTTNMQQPRTPSQLLTRILTHPHTLNQLTSQYLQSLSSPHHPSTTTWPILEQTLQQLSQDNIAIEGYLLLMNAVKCVVVHTFKGVDGVRGNRVSGWIGMAVGERLGGVGEEIDRWQGEIGDVRVYKLVCFGLMLCEMLISMVQSTKQANAANRVMYPELYRFFNTVLNNLPKLSPADPTTIIRPHPQQQQSPPSPSPSPSLKTTKILQTLLSNTRRQAKQKQNKNKKKSQKNQRSYTHQITSYLIAKLVELLGRSFGVCKAGVVQRIGIVSQEINGKLRDIIGEEVNEREEEVEAMDEEDTTLRGIIINYLHSFKPKSLEQPEIDQQNQIIQVKQLTPRFADEQKGLELKKLRTKKKKLIKKLQSDARTAKMTKLQQRKVLQDVRNERIAKRNKKDIFVMQKQTEEAKKEHNKARKIKQIQKEGKGRGKGEKGKLGRVGKFKK